MKRLALFIMAAVALTATAAFSQTATVSPTPGLLESLQPALKTIADAAITVLAAAAIWFIKVKWGIDLSSFRQNTLNLAATNAAGIYKSTGNMPRAVEYLKDAAPDAIEHFAIPDARLPEKIKARVGVIEAAGAAGPAVNLVPSADITQGALRR